MPKKPVNTADVMNDPKMKAAIAGADNLLKNSAKYRGKGMVTGAAPMQTGGQSTAKPAAGTRPIKSDVVRSTMQVARGAGYLADRGKTRAKQINDVIDEAANTGAGKKKK